MNLALHFLSKALTFDPGASMLDPFLASKIVWLDAFITNVDRTFRNTNMLIWKVPLRICSILMSNKKVLNKRSDL